MPYRFTFKSDDNQTLFGCPLQCQTCTAPRATRAGQCSRTTCIGTDLCWQHLLQLHNLRCLPSALGGKGLFAMDKNAAANKILFPKNMTIIGYKGESVSGAVLSNRYADWTAPYGLRGPGGVYQDGACVRGLGSLANGSMGARGANAKYAIENNALVLVARKDIKNGQEIIFNYGTEYRLDEPTTHTTRYARA